MTVGPATSVPFFLLKVEGAEWSHVILGFLLNLDHSRDEIAKILHESQGQWAISDGDQFRISSLALNLVPFK